MMITGCAEKDDLVTITTEYGEIKLILFDETPEHKELFLEMAKAGNYDSTTFHRIMQEFMIQGGDINQKSGITAITTAGKIDKWMVNSLVNIHSAQLHFTIIIFINNL